MLTGGMYCNVLGGSIHDGTLLHSKIQHTTVKTQLATLLTHVHVQPVRSRNTSSNRILPTGPLVAIFQHSLPFLQSESFQTQIGTIHCRAIGPLAHHNGTSAHSPSLTCHLPAPTIECLYRPRYKLTCSSHNFPIRTQSSNQKESIARHTSTSVHERLLNHVFTRVDSNIL
jgi:hypothetical protein